MKLLTLVFTIIVPVISNAVVFQSPNVDPQTYLRYVEDNRKQTVTDFLIKKMNQSLRSNELIIESADIAQPEITLKNINQSSREPLSLYTLQFLKDYAVSSTRLKNTEASSKINCLAKAILKEEVDKKCGLQKKSLKELQSKFRDYSVLAIEAQTYSLHELTDIEILPEQAFHFTLLSNLKKPVSFYGTWQDFALQAMEEAPWTHGNCDSFSTHIEDLSLRMQAEILFPGCVRNVQQSEESQPTKTWMERNKKWVYVTGAVLLGAGIYTMKDKTIVIDRPAFLDF